MGDRLAARPSLASSFGVLMGARALLGIAQAPALARGLESDRLLVSGERAQHGHRVFRCGRRSSHGDRHSADGGVGAAYGWRSTFVVTGIAGWCMRSSSSCSIAIRAKAARSRTRRSSISRKAARKPKARRRASTCSRSAKFGASRSDSSRMRSRFFCSSRGCPTISRARSTWACSTRQRPPRFRGSVRRRRHAHRRHARRRLVKRGGDATRVRKRVLIVGMLLGLAVFGAVSAHDQNAAILSITIAIVGLGISGPVAWSLPSLIAPRGRVGAVAR